jgi:endonuclease-8
VAEFLDDRALERAPELHRLGPDLLADDFDAAEAVRRFRAHPDEPVSELLLNQTVVAGAGNIFRSEALFVAGIDPDKPARDLTDAQLGELIATARKLMKANVGATATGAIVTYGRRRTTSRVHPADALWVYGRGNRPCRRCGTPIAYRKTGINARGLYYCPTCQH